MKVMTYNPAKNKNTKYYLHKHLLCNYILP